MIYSRYISPNYLKYLKYLTSYSVGTFSISYVGVRSLRREETIIPPNPTRIHWAYDGAHYCYDLRGCLTGMRDTR